MKNVLQALAATVVFGVVVGLVGGALLRFVLPPEQIEVERVVTLTETIQIPTDAEALHSEYCKGHTDGYIFGVIYVNTEVVGLPIDPPNEEAWLSMYNTCIDHQYWGYSPIMLENPAISGGGGISFPR